MGAFIQRYSTHLVSDEIALGYIPQAKLIPLSDLSAVFYLGPDAFGWSTDTLCLLPRMS